MAHYRKGFLILITAALWVASAGTAGAQTPFQCFANGGVSTPARSEGYAELVGDLIINCVGGTPTAQGSAVPFVNIEVFLNTSVTSKLLAGNWSEAILLIDEPTPAAQRMCGTLRFTQWQDWQRNLQRRESHSALPQFGRPALTRGNSSA